MGVSGLEPPKVFNDRKTGQNNPRDIEKNDCWKGLFRGRPNESNAGSNSKYVNPPPLLTKKQTGEDDGDFGGKSPSLHDVWFSPIPLMGHCLGCLYYFLQHLYNHRKGLMNLFFGLIFIERGPHTDSYDSLNCASPTIE